MTGANFSVTSEGGVPPSKLHHPSRIILFMPVVDTAFHDWRHALRRLIGILNWENSRGEVQISSPKELPHEDQRANSNPSQRHKMLTVLK